MGAFGNVSLILNLALEQTHQWLRVCAKQRPIVSVWLVPRDIIRTFLSRHISGLERSRSHVWFLGLVPSNASDADLESTSVSEIIPMCK